MVDIVMRKRKKKKRDCIIKYLEGKKVTIVKHDFLPPGTIALASNLFNKLKEKGD
jgi:hypothetical protein